MSRDPLICLALACLTLLLYAPVREHAFINYDDPGYVNEEHVQHGLSAENMGWALTTLNFSNWHPLTWLSHMTDVTLFGNNAGAHHVVNVVFHTINTVLLFLVLRAMTGRRWESVAVAALWTAHPLRVESVAWVAERKDLLCAMFFLLAIACYGRYARRGSKAAYAGSLICFALGLASKAMIVTLPGVLLLLDVWPLRRTQRWRQLVIEKIPFFLLTAASAVVTYIAQRRGGAMNAGQQIPLVVRIGNALASLARYLELTVWPRGLAVFYPYAGGTENARVDMPRAALGVVLLIAGFGIAAALWRRRGERSVMIGWLWFLGTLVPVIGLVQVGRQSLADRYTYIPHIGLFVAVVWMAATLTSARAAGVVARRAAFAVLALVVLALSIRTRHQLGYWRDSESLFSHALSVTKENTVALVNLAQVRSERGEHAAAMDLYRQAMEISPHDPFIWFNMSRVLSAAGRIDEALRYGKEAIRLAPENFAAHYEYAVDLAEHGHAREALPEFEITLQLQPQAPQAHYAYGLALRDAGEPARAAEAFRHAAELARRRHNEPLLRQIEAQLAKLTAATTTTSTAPITSSAAGGEKPAPALPNPATNPDNRPRDKRSDSGQP